ncbi:MAG: hypothetical protein OYG31_02870 [Candidatus Kaiserbacteria bacterium]|nr:hypothetical protein [Candidatus Kaiserbacteria bacterium]
MQKFIIGLLVVVFIGVGVAISSILFPPVIEIEACHSQDGKYATFTLLDIKKTVRTSRESTIEAMTEMGFEIEPTSESCYIYRKTF